MDDTADGAKADATRVHAPLTDRANREPVILRGLTSSEAQAVIFIVMPIYTVIGLVVAFATKMWALGVLIASLAPMLTVWTVAGWIAKVKRNKPDYYYQHRFKLWLAEKGLIKSRFIDHDGFWETGLDVPFSRRLAKGNRPNQPVKKVGV